MSPLTRLRALDPRRLPEAGVLVTDGEADAVAEELAAAGELESLAARLEREGR